MILFYMEPTFWNLNFHLNSFEVYLIFFGLFIWYLFYMAHWLITDVNVAYRKYRKQRYMLYKISSHIGL